MSVAPTEDWVKRVYGLHIITIDENLTLRYTNLHYAILHFAYYILYL